MADTLTRRMTIDEFLALPDEKPYKEFLRGDVTEKPMVNDAHGTLVSELIGRLWSYLTATGEGRVKTEVRHADRGQQWVFLPDIHVDTRPLTAADRRGPVETMPAFVIEVLSPDDRASRVFERVELYARAGVPLLWVVDPELETITSYRPGEPHHVYHAGDIADARPVLQEFRLDVGELFAAVREEVTGDAAGAGD